jgi:hypothetical protein
LCCPLRGPTAARPQILVGILVLQQLILTAAPGRAIAPDGSTVGDINTQIFFTQFQVRRRAPRPPWRGTPGACALTRASKGTLICIEMVIFTCIFFGTHSYRDLRAHSKTLFRNSLIRNKS